MKKLYIIFLGDGRIQKESFSTKYGYCEAKQDAQSYLSSCYYDWKILTEEFI
jgi:hypothetical protein